MSPVEKTGWVFKRAPQFKKAFDNLNPEAQRAARDAYREWKKDPLDRNSKYRPHKIIRLSAIYHKTVYGITLGPDFKVTFLVDGNVIVSLDIGNHSIYG